MLVIVDSDFDNFSFYSTGHSFRHDFHHSLTQKSKTQLVIQTMIGLIAYQKHDCSANEQMLLLYLVLMTQTPFSFIYTVIRLESAPVDRILPLSIILIELLITM